MSYLNINGLRKVFDDFVAVDDFNLDIKKGEFVSLLGPSGCGKTTTIQMLGGFLEPTAGQIVLDGVDITHKKANKRGLGVVFQTYALFPHMDVFHNISFGLEMRKLSQKEIEYKVSKTLKLVGLEQFSKRYPSDISGGQRQRVALARALVFNPPLLLLDEPLSNLDAKLREGMQIELRAIQQNLGTTTIMVTHDQQEALALSDRIVILNNSKIEQIGLPQEIYNHPKTRFCLHFLGQSNRFSIKLHKHKNKRIIKLEKFEVSLDHLEVDDEDHFEFYVRPEKIRMIDNAHEGLSGVITSKLFLGFYLTYTVSTSVGDILVHTQEKFRNSEVGERIGLVFQPNDIIAF